LNNKTDRKCNNLSSKKKATMRKISFATDFTAPVLVGL
jgi:hypothetical protein